MYRRFLNKNDYLGIITEDALSQLTRGKDICFVQAEQAAEASIMDYLTENYEIERELNRGKFIFEYDRRISYPIGSMATKLLVLYLIGTKQKRYLTWKK